VPPSRPVKGSVHERADILRVMTGAPFDRLRLAALRYAVNEEAEQYVAVMRVFTEGTAGCSRTCPQGRSRSD
jgi:hypothetical protein